MAHKPKLAKPAARTALLKNNRLVPAPTTWRSDKSGANERGYTYAWQQARKRWLELHPLCVYCKRDGSVRPATVVDHVVPHRGDMALFWDRENWQSLCFTCHSSKKQAEENVGL